MTLRVSGLTLLIGIFAALMPGVGASLRADGHESSPHAVVIFGTAHRSFPRGVQPTYPDAQAYSEDLVDIVARAAGFPYRIVENDNWLQLKADLLAGRIDVIPTIARTPERMGTMLFTVPHVRGALVVMVRTDGPPVHSLSDLEGRKIAVVDDSYDAGYMRKRGFGAELLLQPRASDAFEAMLAGKVDAAVANELVSISWIRKEQMDNRVKIAFTLPDSVIEFCMVVRPDNEKLLGELNDGLFLAQQNGDLRRNYEKWFQTFEPTEGDRRAIARRSALGLGGVLILGLLGLLWHRRRLWQEHLNTLEVERLVAERTQELAMLMERLRESEEKFSNAFRTNPAAIGILDYTTRTFVEVNDQFPRIFGHPKDEFIGRTPLEIGLWGRDETDRCVRELQVGTIRDMELACRRKDGVPLACLVSAEVVGSGLKRIIVLTLNDITLKKQAAEEKDRLKVQLQQTQRLEALGTLAGGIAHDFNNILTAIIANIDLVETGTETPSVREHIGEIKRASKRAKELVHRILTFSRQQTYERVPVRLPLLLEEAVGLLRPTLPASVEIRTRFDPSTPMILGDPGQIHQVVMNLCTNAAHAMREGGGGLVIQCEAQEVDEALCRQHPDLHVGRWARLVVSDGGHGMDANTLLHIFEPFFTTKPPGEGSGLGLAVVHGIVQEHEGVILVESRPSGGTTFTLYLPQMEATELPPEPAADIPASTGRSECILLLDDEPMVLGAVRAILERKLGYRVSAFSQPQAALEIFREECDKFSLIITDLTMPGMTGIDVARQALAVCPSIPILLMTGYSDIWTQEKVRALGIRDLILKPVSYEEIARAVRRLLDESQAGKA